MKKLNPRALEKVILKMEFETGRMDKTIGEVLKLKKGTLLKIEKSKKDVIQVYINNKHFADGKALRKSGLMFVEITDLQD